MAEMERLQDRLELFKYDWYPRRSRVLKYLRYARRLIDKALLYFFDLRELVDLESERRLGNSYASDEIFTRNRSLKNKHIGKTAFILGNGPSLNKIDLSLLKDHVTLATNTYWRHPEVKNWQPTYYCLADGSLFNPKVGSLTDYSGPSTKEAIFEYFERIRELCPQSTFLLPYQTAYKPVSTWKLLEPEKCFFIPFFPTGLGHGVGDFPDLSRGLRWPQDISQFAILCAMSMGIKEIYLLGSDHNWAAILGPEEHFFEGPTHNLQPGKDDSSKNPYGDLMWFQWVEWKGHHSIRKLAEKHGVRIYNGSPGSFLDSFPKRFDLKGESLLKSKD